VGTVDPVATGVGLREQKKQKTLAALQRAALDLVAAHGFDRVTIDDIAAAADVSKTTFYRYLATKEDALLANRAEKLEYLRLALAAQPPDAPPLEAVRVAVREVAQRYQHDRRQMLALAKITRVTPSLAARTLEYDAASEELLREYFARRDPDGAASLRPWVRAALVVATLRAARDYWLTRGAALALPDLVDDALRILIDKEGTG
jgi:AcrR family transcriptional regulator